MEEKKEKKKGLLGNWIVRNLLLACLFVIALGVVSYIFLGVITKHNKEIEVPDLTNMDLITARRVASQEGLRLQVIDSVFLRRMEKGVVYVQNPKPGGKVKKGRRILVTINAVNAKKVSMPNLVGYSMRQARAELSARGLMLGRLIYVDDMATNNVLKQLYNNREISPGKQIESGSDIDLVVGLNSSDNLTTVPDVTGMKYIRAVDVIHDNSLNVKALIFDNSVRNYSDSLNAVVYRQGPKGSNAPTQMGSGVSLYLSVDPNRGSSSEASSSK